MATERMSRPPLSPNERSVRHTRVEDEHQIEESYISGEILGQGSFGVVREAVQKETGKKFAIKIINKEKVEFCLCLLICLCLKCVEKLFTNNRFSHLKNCCVRS